MSIFERCTIEFSDFAKPGNHATKPRSIIIIPKISGVLIKVIGEEFVNHLSLFITIHRPWTSYPGLIIVATLTDQANNDYAITTINTSSVAIQTKTHLRSPHQ